MPHLSVAVDLGTADEVVAIEAALLECGAISVTLADARDDPVLEPAPGEVRLWPATRIEALFAAERADAALLARIASATGVGIDRLRVRAVADKQWEREWLRDFRAMRFGRRLWVAPRHEPVEDPDARVVRLDPGLAFGTGTHATTAMCLEWLDAHLEPGAFVVDYGCGSGILALAAARLGARRVDCFDIDPQALLATRQNALANGLAKCIAVHETPDRIRSCADVLLANILSGPLCELAPVIASLVRAGGRIVLAGLLRTQSAEVTRAYASWFDIAAFREREEWCTLAGSRR
jgi:ribosomal protein L11 methyltransferase